MARVDELRKSFVEAHKALAEALDSLERDQLDRSSSNDGWTAKDTLAHITTIEDRQRQQIRTALEGRPWIQTEDIDTYNERKVAERRSWSVERLREEFEREHQATLDLLASLQDADLDRIFNHPRRGPMTLDQMFSRMPGHTQLHASEVLAAARGQQSVAR